MINTLFRNTPDGGDVAVSRNGIERGDYLHAAVYCALFGGNIAENTKDEYRRYDENKSYWGNAFLRRQFNSQTERELQRNLTTAAGLDAIRKAIFTDLQKLIPNDIDGITEVYVERNGKNPRKTEISIYLSVRRNARKFIFEV
jgi:phage gp46-like protein